MDLSVDDAFDLGERDICQLSPFSNLTVGELSQHADSLQPRKVALALSCEPPGDITESHIRAIGWPDDESLDPLSSLTAHGGPWKAYAEGWRSVAVVGTLHRLPLDIQTLWNEYVPVNEARRGFDTLCTTLEEQAERDPSIRSLCLHVREKIGGLVPRRVVAKHHLAMTANAVMAMLSTLDRFFHQAPADSLMQNRHDGGLGMSWTHVRLPLQSVTLSRIVDPMALLR